MDEEKITFGIYKKCNFQDLKYSSGNYPTGSAAPVMDAHALANYIILTTILYNCRLTTNSF